MNGLLEMSKVILATWLLVAYVGSLGAAPDLISMILLAAVAAFGLRGFLCYTRTSRPQTRKVVASLVAITLAAAISSGVAYANGLDVERSLGLAVRIAFTFVMFFSGYYLGYRSSAKTAYLVVVYIALAHAIIAMIGVAVGTAPVIGGVVRPSGFLSPNIVANSVMIGAICSLTLFVYAKRRSWFGIWSGLYFLALSGFLVYAATLKNVLTLGFGMFVVYLCYYRTFRFSRVVKFAFWLSIVAVVVLVATPTGERLINTANSALGYGQAYEGLSSLEWRVGHWELLLLDWWNNYRLTGSGVGQAVNMAGIREQYDQEGPVAHNDYVALLVEFGPLLGAIVISSWIVIIKGIFAAFADRPLLKVTTAGAVSCVFLAMVGGNVMYTVAYIYLVWLVLGGSYGELDRQRCGSWVANPSTPRPGTSRVG